MASRTNLLACFDNLLLVIRISDSLDSCEGFPSVPLLNPNVDQTVLNTVIQLICISKWVYFLNGQQLVNCSSIDQHLIMISMCSNTKDNTDRIASSFECLRRT